MPTKRSVVPLENNVRQRSSAKDGERWSERTSTYWTAAECHTTFIAVEKPEASIPVNVESAKSAAKVALCEYHMWREAQPFY